MEHDKVVPRFNKGDQVRFRHDYKSPEGIFIEYDQIMEISGVGAADYALVGKNLLGRTELFTVPIRDEWFYFDRADNSASSDEWDELRDKVDEFRRILPQHLSSLSTVRRVNAALTEAGLETMPTRHRMRITVEAEVESLNGPEVIPKIVQSDNFTIDLSDAIEANSANSVKVSKVTDVHLDYGECD